MPVAYDGLSIVVHPSNDFVNQLTVDQIKLIFLSNQQPTTKWSDIDASWPDKPIKIFSPGTDSGTFDYFKEVVAGKEGSLRGDMSTSEDDSVLVNGVAGDPNAIGFFGAAYYFQNKDKLKVVKIVNPQTGTAEEPTPESIESGKYAPFSRPLFIYINVSALDQPQVDEFANFYLQEAGKLAAEVGYVPLPGDVYSHAVENLQGGVTGTHYWTKEREPRHGKVTEIFQSGNLTEF
jgi:phosphate transport system substrate-binding protein